jgi:hypothetical protein
MVFFDNFVNTKRADNTKFNTNLTVQVVRNPIEHKALKAPKGLNEANISHIRPNIRLYNLICNVYQIERLIGT